MEIGITNASTIASPNMIETMTRTPVTVKGLSPSRNSARIVVIAHDGTIIAVGELTRSGDVFTGTLDSRLPASKRYANKTNGFTLRARLCIVDAEGGFTLAFTYVRVVPSPYGDTVTSALPSGNPFEGIAIPTIKSTANLVDTLTQVLDALKRLP